MFDETWTEIGETFFAVAIAAAIGVGAATLAIHVNQTHDARGETTGTSYSNVSHFEADKLGGLPAGG